MPVASEPHHAGGHRLGPHVVGTRVVVRRVLPGQTGPSGGPAMTDVLGVCLAWDVAGDGTGGWCLVQPALGEPVRIALADIVSGKPVPPRPSVRHRVTPLEAQERALALWPDLHTEPLGGWLLRRSPTATARRANSVLAFEPSGVDDDVDRVVAFYEDTPSGRPIAAVLPDSPEYDAFRSRGWVPESGDADTVFQLAGVAGARRGLETRDDVRLEVSGALAVARVEVDGRTVASGIAAYARDWVGFRGIEVDPAHRRGGLGRAVMAALLEWGAEQGATTAYLQVIGDNAGGRELYGRLGFTDHHAYRYLTRTPPG